MVVVETHTPAHSVRPTAPRASVIPSKEAHISKMSTPPTAFLGGRSGLAKLGPGLYGSPVQHELQQYLPVLMLILVAIGFTAFMLIFSVIAGKVGKRSKVKDSAYECGMVPVGKGTARFSVKFYLVAMLFILFDIEVVFLYPWAVSYKAMLADPATRDMILLAMLSFVGVLLVGYIYAVKKRAFDWND